ncbi:porin [Enterovibrio nigricans]|uniref:Outer membrane protein OmpU n=1 Tax=Enterovibrio nigricans DSM 22720 TaxID=1121868 RepID=A0A1T4TSK1_9GAMM|nr:porin [Enterovibrio nigricans]PKF51895.1 porin [Enterovibrio nigricans]SKA43455.1 outer membrane protein OmpU [Enterovibrio nigricans DSM 22720]
MNKKFIAIAVAALASTSVSAAEIFNDGTSSMELGGRAEARASIVDGDMSDKSRVRLNVRGTTEIAEGVYGFGFFEREFTSANDTKNIEVKDSAGNIIGTSTVDVESNDNRYINAGISTQYGAIAYGLTDGSLGIITDFTDIMSYAGAVASGKIKAADRTTNNILYVGEFGGLTVKANYVGTNDEIDSGYSAAATYALENGLSMGLGYAAQDNLNNTDSDQVEAAVSYAFGDFYVAALYNTGEVAKADVDGYEFAAAYTMGQTKFTTTYGNKEVADKEAADALSIDATHFFNDNFRAYASYTFDMMKNAEDEIAMGLRYDF